MTKNGSHVVESIRLESITGVVSTTLSKFPVSYAKDDLWTANGKIYMKSAYTRNLFLVLYVLFLIHAEYL